MFLKLKDYPLNAPIVTTCLDASKYEKELPLCLSGQARSTFPTHIAAKTDEDNGLSNLRGTVAVARGADPNSGTAQFFFNLVDNRRLDFVGNQSGLTWGFAVFGKVTRGLDVLDKIAALPTRPLGPFAGDVPNPLVTIDSARVIGEETPAPGSSVATPAKTGPTKPGPAKPGKKPVKHAGNG